MKFSKKHFVAGLIGNAALVILGIVAIIMIALEKPQLGELFKYFTVISNLLVVLVSLVGVCLYASSIAKNKNRVSELFQIIKLIRAQTARITVFGTRHQGQQDSLQRSIGIGIHNRSEYSNGSVIDSRFTSYKSYK